MFVITKHFIFHCKNVTSWHSQTAQRLTASEEWSPNHFAWVTKLGYNPMPSSLKKGYYFDYNNLSDFYTL